MAAVRPTFLIIVGISVVAFAGLLIVSQKMKEASDAADTQRLMAMSPADRAKEIALANQKPQKTEAEQLNDARIACELVVKKSLHDPDSAQFDDYRHNWAKRLGPQKFEVQVHLRARNGFNALRASLIDCKIGLSADTWYAISLKTIR